MTLESLIRGTTMISITGGTGGVVRGLCCDSRSIRADDLFFALPGTRDDGGRHVAEAVAGGAIAVVSGGDHPGLSVPLVRVADARAAMADLAAAFYAFPSSSLAVTGVTGTNGKTTTAWMIRHLCMTVGRSCGLIGTIEYILPGEVVPATRTTPESIDIQRMLARMSEGGFRAASLEVSSHALVQQRVRAVQFDTAVFTNLCQYHLDYHASMEA
jgi:UDP-N-acetylmuramoyl-L-alanyl-D-glutamate--2,6-diaminopimelate ligase